MKYRNLRIAWSVAWGVLCLLLVVLWALSFETKNGRYQSAAYHNVAWSFQGGKTVVWTPAFPKFSGATGGPKELGRIDWLGVRLIFSSWSSWDLQVSFWIPIVAAGLIAVVPWLRWRYSLRTLLIGMTVVAIGLGWIVYAIR